MGERRKVKGGKGLVGHKDRGEVREKVAVDFQGVKGE